VTLIVDDLATEALGVPLNVLGRDGDARQLPQQLVAFLEADPCANDTDHPQHVWRERDVFNA
jgi:hypothetical protein